MFRVWGKICKDNRFIRDITVADDTEDTRTHKVFHALDEICQAFDWNSMSSKKTDCRAVSGQKQYFVNSAT